MPPTAMPRLPSPPNRYDVRVEQERNRLIETAIAGPVITVEDSLWTDLKGRQVQESPALFAAAFLWSPGTQGLLTKVILSANITFTFDTGNLATGAIARLVTQQDATGGRTITWPSNVTWGLAGAPAVDTTASTQSEFTFRWNGTKWCGVMVGTKYAI